MASPDRVRALTFDVGGTVFDWHHTLRDELAALVGEVGGADAAGGVDTAGAVNHWRRRTFELLGAVRRGERPWANLDELHRDALDDVVDAHDGLELSVAQRDELTRAWHRLRPWPDAPGAIHRLRSRYTVVVLTVLSWSLVVDASKAADVVWDGILSCEFLGHYKPDAEAYLAGLRLLGVAPDETMMVAAHPSDLRAAAAAGLRTAYVARPDEWGPGGRPDDAPGEGDFDVVAADFDDLVRRLGA